jgi:uncharacterized RDD family membrane protein YckC
VTAGDDWGGEPAVDTGEAPLAGRGLRLVAYLLNVVILVGPLLVLTTAVDEDAPTGSTREAVLGLAILAWLLASIIANLVLLGTRGQSIGKIIVGVRIVRCDGTRADFVHVVLVRSLANVALSMVPIYGLVDTLFIFRRDRRCIHDLLADTKVVVA